MKKYRFRAEIQAGGGGGAFVFFPYDVEKEFGVNGKVPVKVLFNGVPYAGSLFKYGYPQHLLAVLKKIREQTGTRPGDTIQVELWRDEKPQASRKPS